MRFIGFALIALILVLPSPLPACMWVSVPAEGVEALNPIERREVPPAPGGQGPGSHWRSLTELMDEGWKPSSTEPIYEAVSGYGIPPKAGGLGILLVFDFYGHCADMQPLFQAGSADPQNRLRYDTVAALVYALENDKHLHAKREATRLMHHLLLHGPWGLKTVAMVGGGAAPRTVVHRKDWLNPLLRRVLDRSSINGDLDKIIGRYLAKGMIAEGWENLHESQSADQLLQVANDTDESLILRIRAAESLCKGYPVTARIWALDALHEREALIQLQAVRVLRSQSGFQRMELKRVDNLEILCPDLIGYVFDCGTQDDAKWLISTAGNRLFDNSVQCRLLRATLKGLSGDGTECRNLLDHFEEMLGKVSCTWRQRVGIFESAFTVVSNNGLNLPHSVAQWRKACGQSISFGAGSVEGERNLLGPVPPLWILKALAYCGNADVRLRTLRLIFPKAPLQAIALGREDFELILGESRSPLATAVKEALKKYPIMSSVPLHLDKLQQQWLEFLPEPLNNSEKKYLSKRLERENYFSNKVVKKIEVALKD